MYCYIVTQRTWSADLRLEASSVFFRDSGFALSLTFCRKQKKGFRLDLAKPRTAPLQRIGELVIHRRPPRGAMGLVLLACVLREAGAAPQRMFCNERAPTRPIMFFGGFTLCFGRLKRVLRGPYLMVLSSEPLIFTASSRP